MLPATATPAATTSSSFGCVRHCLARTGNSRVCTKVQHITTKHVAFGCYSSQHVTAWQPKIEYGPVAKLAKAMPTGSALNTSANCSPPGNSRLQSWPVQGGSVHMTVLPTSAVSSSPMVNTARTCHEVAGAHAARSLQARGETVASCSSTVALLSACHTAAGANRPYPRLIGTTHCCEHVTSHRQPALLPLEASNVGASLGDTPQPAAAGLRQQHVRALLPALQQLQHCAALRAALSRLRLRAS